MSDDVETLERGNLYFFYRPKLEQDDPGSRADVQRLYLVLSPDRRDRYRLAVIGRKRLPDPGRSGRARFWCFVQKVTNRADTIERELQETSYSTKTRGARRAPAARPAGEGVYRILRHGNHTHLVYALELPKHPEEVQEAFEIEEEASYIISIKNPQKGSPASAGLSEEQKAEYPKGLQEVFRDRRFADADPTDLLDYPGTEFLLVAASEDPGEELGIRLDADAERESTADIFKDLRLDKDAHPLKPLFEGHWD